MRLLKLVWPKDAGHMNEQTEKHTANRIVETMAFFSVRDSCRNILPTGNVPVA